MKVAASPQVYRRCPLAVFLPVCFHQKSRRVNPAIPSAAFLMQIKYKRLSPHVPRTSPFSSAIFHAARTLSGSLRGEGFIRRYSFSSYVCIRSDVMGKAVFSYRSLPRMGKGDRASGG